MTLNLTAIYNEAYTKGMSRELDKVFPGYQEGDKKSAIKILAELDGKANVRYNKSAINAVSKIGLSSDECLSLYDGKVPESFFNSNEIATKEGMVKLLDFKKQDSLNEALDECISLDLYDRFEMELKFPEIEDPDLSPIPMVFTKGNQEILDILKQENGFKNFSQNIDEDFLTDYVNLEAGRENMSDDLDESVGDDKASTWDSVFSFVSMSLYDRKISLDEAANALVNLQVLMRRYGLKASEII